MQTITLVREKKKKFLKFHHHFADSFRIFMLEVERKQRVCLSIYFTISSMNERKWNISLPKHRRNITKCHENGSCLFMYANLGAYLSPMVRMLFLLSQQQSVLL